MEYYLSTETILNTYKLLAFNEFDNRNILFTFLIMKAVGFNSLEYKSVNLIKENGYEYAFDLSSLFNSHEERPKECDFINPFDMDAWSNNPKENLNKWISNRVKNNVIGGATTWRKFVMIDDDEKIKFKSNYIDVIKDLCIVKNNISINLLALWACRFLSFESEVGFSKIIDHFKNRFSLNNEEVVELFSISNPSFDLKYESSYFNTVEIRKLIGNPTNNNEWIESKKNIYKENVNYPENERKLLNRMNTNLSKDDLSKLVDEYYQVILYGPPGTSKSYIANELVQNYDCLLKIQFHPQYSYQQFIGGYIVRGDQVVYESGIFTKFLKDGIDNPQKKYILLIDEVNRANISQVFGELISILDRGTKISALIDGKSTELYIPENFHIICTMNNTDRTLAKIDLAIKRRFMNIPFKSDPNILIDLCRSSGEYSLSDFLSKINNNLYEVTKNPDFEIGHALFLYNKFIDDNNKFYWSNERLKNLFDYKIFPTIEEYCFHDSKMISDVLGPNLSKPLKLEDFEKSILDYLYD